LPQCQQTKVQPFSPHSSSAAAAVRARGGGGGGPCNGGAAVALPSCW